jgi:hypothetical protein
MYTNPLRPCRFPQTKNACSNHALCIYNTTFNSRLPHRRPTQIHALMILSTRHIRMMRITLVALIFNIKYTFQLPTRDHILLSRTG